MTEKANAQDAGELLIEYILAHKKEYAQDFLESKGSPYSGNKEILRRRLKDLLSDGRVTQKDLASFLDQIELFGNQHVYLFDIGDPQLEILLDSDRVRTILEAKGLGELYNNYKPLILPETAEIASIAHDSDWFSIRWVVKKEKLQLIEQKRETDEGGREFLIKKYLVRKYRATTFFRVSLINGSADLFVHRLRSGLSYTKERDKYLEWLNDWFGWGMLKARSLLPAISRIETSGEVRIRDVGIETAKGSHIGISSSGTRVGITSDPDAANARKSISAGAGSRGNFYWLPEKSEGYLNSEIHTILYRDRALFLGECEEKEISYVLGRIRGP